jgi:uncharacterized repeat protein (TIGR03806 family)
MDRRTLGVSLKRAARTAALAALAGISGCTGGGGSGSKASTCVAPARPPLGSIAALEPAFDPLRFRKAISMYQRPGDDQRWYVAEQRGTIQTFLPGETVATQYIDLTAEVADGSSEAGLLGMAFHPDFALNGRLFLSYTVNGTPFVSHVAEVTGSVDGLSAVGPPQILMEVDQPYENHNGGDIKFGHDDYLYISFGDGGAANDPQDNGQDVNTLLAKMLRIDVDSASPYAIPADNPFAAGGGSPEIFAWGLRNMWRFSFDRATGDLWGADVGQNQWEEVDIVELGKNYGWNEKEGTHCFEANEPCDDPQWTDPVAEYDHGDGESITGGYVYRGTAIPELIGAYIYGDYSSGTIWALLDGSSVPEPILDSGLNISAFGEGADGELYVIDYATSVSRIYKMVPAGKVGTGNLPVLLSATGCVKPDDPKKPVDALVPYDVNVPLWSDGAVKQRWLSLPADTRITVEPDGDWTLPIGTVLLKEFALAGKRIETRLFVRHLDGGWAGYTYEWDDAETDATLVVNGKTKTIGDQTWRYPSGTECLECHSDAAGRSLGLETAQLNRDFAAGAKLSGNQLAYLERKGLFESDPGDPEDLAAFPAPDDETASLESRARAYLHANCSNCHRPGGTTQSSMDLRASATLADTATCNVDPLQGTFGHPGAKLLLPGDAKESMIVIRMHLLGDGRMPDVASSLVDQQGSHLVAQWIDSLTVCP